MAIAENLVGAPFNWDGVETNCESIAKLLATGGLRDVIQSVRDVLDTETGKVFLGQISELADDAINNLAPLSKIIKEINDASRNIGKEITTSQTLEQSKASIFTDTNKKINDALKDSANKFVKALEQNIQNSKINKALEDQIGLGTKELGSLLDTIYRC